MVVTQNALIKTMKKELKLLTFVLAANIIISCGKERHYPPLPQPAPQPITFFEANKEYFWAQKWSKTSTGYETHLSPSMLTDSTIRQGIKVSVAMWTEMTQYDSIPSIFYDFSRKDSVHLSYKATPGELKVFARTALELNYESDVLIEYK